VTSALLITAAVGAMILAHVERRREEKVSQPAMMRSRVGPGSYPARKRCPGVFPASDTASNLAALAVGAAA